jgi:O-antigen/teichoic acid export membrane protein
MQINKIDVLWNYSATFFKIASSAILLPIILHVLPSQEVGIWAIFSSISALIFLLDLGFNSSFARNVTYVFSGVQSLKKEGFNDKIEKGVLNYELLNGVLNAMKWFYSRVSVVLLIILLTIGSWYIWKILKGFEGDKTEIIVAWLLYCIISTYNLYTLYYDALLEGRGLIRVSKQITILGNVLYLVVGATLVFCGLGLVALVCAQLVSIILIRTLSYKIFFTKDLQSALQVAASAPRSEILSAVSPNALKYGLTSLGGFMIQKSAVFIGSLFITLSAIASFGITKQLVDILVAVANITLATYLPQITKLRVDGDLKRIKEIYLKGILISNMVFIGGAFVIIFLGQPILSLLNSNTNLVPYEVIAAMAFSALVGLNSGISGAVISTRNEIPFMKPSLYSGLATIVALLVIFKFTNLGVLGMALAPGLVDLCYQGWKWPLVVFKELEVKWKDIVNVSKQLTKQTLRI